MAGDGLRFCRAGAPSEGAAEELRPLPPCTEVIEGELRCHCWLTHSEHRVVAGTSTGALLIYEACQYACKLDIEVEGGVASVAPLARGLVCGSQLGSVHAFGPGSSDDLCTLFAPNFVVSISTSPVISLTNRPDELECACVTSDRQCSICLLYTSDAADD